MLANYLSETRSLLNDGQGQFFSDATLTNFVNRARRRIAYASNCLRVVPPNLFTVPNQEQYPLDHWLPQVQQVCPQARQVLSVHGLSIGIGGKWFIEPSGEWRVSWGSWKPSWRRLVWSDFQARLRIYSGSFIGAFTAPGWYSEYMGFPSRKLFLAPIPTIPMPMEVDVSLVPQPLLTDDDEDPIPYPFQDAVAYWAAVMALLQQQRPQDAQNMIQLFATDLPMCVSAMGPWMTTNPYGSALRTA